MEYIIYRELSCIVGLSFLTLFLCLNKGMEPFIRKCFIAMVVLQFVQLVTSELESWLAYWPTRSVWRVHFSIVSYSVRPILLYILCIMRNRDCKSRMVRTLLLLPAIINTLIMATAWFSPIAFSFNEQNHFQRGPLGYASHITFAVYLVLLAGIFFWNVRNTLAHGLKAVTIEDWLIMATVVYISVCVVLDTMLPYTTMHFLNNAMMICTASYYIYFQTYGMYSDLQNERRSKAKAEEENRIAIMLSQIQPHFLFNSLNSICYLIRKDPELAEETLIDFGKFIRKNLDSLNQRDPIPFQDAFDHLKTYLDLEQLRFRKKLNVVYDIQCWDFSIPPLIMQPIAENAVRHGVTKKADGGTVTISTKKVDGKYVVTISDDGVGFDPAAPYPKDGKSHIGMQNVQARIESMSKGRMYVHSEIGKGTIVTIEIPGGVENANHSG